MFQQLKNKIVNMVKGEDEPAINFIPNLMKRVHKDKDGTLASRMVRQFIPLGDLQPPKVKKKHKVWYGDKIYKRILKGQCASKRTEGVIGGAIRLMKQERMLNKLNPGSTCNGL
jgi:hypothetical protein